MQTGPSIGVYVNKSKRNVVPVHAIKAYMGSRGIAPLILNPRH
jgi:hypothetical protein